METPFDLDRVLDETFVGAVRYHDTVKSTNTDALNFCAGNSISDPLLVITSQQTAGRGRGANQWWSAAGSLTFSLVVNPHRLRLVEDRWPQASLTVGLSVCRSLEALVPHQRIQLKWPNDVFCDGRKVCGILVEVGGKRPHPVLVMGIGVNVNNSFAPAPQELRSIATSLTDASGQNLDVTEVLIRILNQLDEQLNRLRDTPAAVATDWQDRCALTGRSIEIEVGQRSVSGVCQGIDDEGAIVLLTAGGLERFFGGVVSKIR